MPMQDKSPTIRSRALGSELRAGLRAADLTAQRVAELVGWNPSTFTRLMLGERRAKESDLATVLALLGIKGPRRERLLELGRDYYTQTWLQEFPDHLPVTLDTLASHEATARGITLYAPTLVPDLLQTQDYARALLTASPTLPKAEVEDRIKARLERQQVLHDSPLPKVVVLLGAAALSTEVGAPAILAEQREHLRRLAGRPNITLRVVPASYGPQTVVSCGFTRLRGERYSPVVCLQTEVTALFLEKASHLAAYDSIVKALERGALDTQESLELLDAPAGARDGITGNRP